MGYGYDKQFYYSVLGNTDKYNLGVVIIIPPEIKIEVKEGVYALYGRKIYKGLYIAGMLGFYHEFYEDELIKERADYGMQISYLINLQSIIHILNIFHMYFQLELD